MLRETPFHARTGVLCRSRAWRRWAGYVAASSYELTHEHEYHAIRSSAALFDVSPLFKYRIEGPHALALVNRVVTRDVETCAVGQVMYTPWCDPDGKVRDDGTLHRLTEERFRLTAAEPNLRWLHENAHRLDVTLTDETDRVGALALQGPASADVLREVADGDVDGLGFFRVVDTSIGDIPVQLSRTGYTGDLGYEIWVEAGHAVALWDALIESGGPYGITPAGLLALDIARVEAGLILIDVDYVPAHRAVIGLRKSSPFELGLGWAVRLEKTGFVGHAALRDEAARPSGWELHGIEVDWDSLEAAYATVALPPQLPWITVRESVPVYVEDYQIGYATSRCWSPTLKKYVGLAHLEASSVNEGDEVEIEITVEHRRRRALARVAKTPFFDPPRKRATTGPAGARG